MAVSKYATKAYSGVLIPAGADNILLDDEALERLGLFVAALTQGHSSVALACDNMAWLQHHMLAMTSALRTQTKAAVTVQPHSSLESLLNQFNDLVSNLPIASARSQTNTAAQPHVWLMQSTEYYSADTLNTLQRLIKDFPGASLQLAFVLHGDLASSPLAQWPELWCWPIQTPTLSQGQAIVGRARLLGLSEEAQAWVDRAQLLAPPAQRAQRPAAPPSEPTPPPATAPTQRSHGPLPRLWHLRGRLVGMSTLAVGTGALMAAGLLLPQLGAAREEIQSWWKNLVTPVPLPTMAAPSNTPPATPTAAAQPARPDTQAVASVDLQSVKPSLQAPKTSAPATTAVDRQPEAKAAQTPTNVPIEEATMAPAPAPATAPVLPAPPAPGPTPATPAPISTPAPASQASPPVVTRAPALANTKPSQPAPPEVVRAPQPKVAIASATMAAFTPPVLAQLSNQTLKTSSVAVKEVLAVTKAEGALPSWSANKPSMASSMDKDILPITPVPAIQPIPSEQGQAAPSTAPVSVGADWARALPDDKWLIRHTVTTSAERAALWAGSRIGLSQAHVVRIQTGAEQGQAYAVFSGPFADRAGAERYARALQPERDPDYMLGSDVKTAVTSAQALP
jgi:hypothetical protein